MLWSNDGLLLAVSTNVSAPFGSTPLKCARYVSVHLRVETQLREFDRKCPHLHFHVNKEVF